MNANAAPSSPLAVATPATPTGAVPRPGLRRVVAYAAPHPDVPVRLNANESPYPPPARFLAEVAEEIRRLQLNRYPDREASALRSALARRAGRSPDGVWIANGSNEVIQQLLLAYGGPARRALVFEPTYALHAKLAWATHTDVVRVSLASPFDVEPTHVEAAASTRPDVVFLCSPNNPTGLARPVEVATELARRLPTALIVVDEAYIEFGGASALEALDATPNLAIVRTFSKAFALAGARLGSCLASPDVIEDVRRVRLPYNVSALTQAAGMVALRHAAEVDALVDAIRRQRDRIVEELEAMPGVTAYPSDANFVLFRTPVAPGDAWARLVERGVCVRDVSEAVPGCLRVTAGTPSETGAFLDALRDVVASAPIEEGAR